MIGHLYYIIGLIILMLSFSNIIHYYRFINTILWIQSFVKISGSPPTSKDFRSEIDYTVYLNFNSFTSIGFYWTLLGLITNSWVVFLYMIVLHFVLKFILDSKFITVSKHFGFLFNIIKSSLILLLIINHFHLHIDLLKLL